MNDRDQIAFDELMVATFSVFDKLRPEEGAMKIWWNALATHNFNDVQSGFEAHLMDPVAGRFPPRPADIIKKINDRSGGDGWISADEAFALYPKSETESSVVFDEMHQAWVIASDLMPDLVAARMAFRPAYERLIAQARAEGRRPVYTASLGTDKHGRVVALEKAAERGLISNDYAALKVTNEPIMIAFDQMEDSIDEGGAQNGKDKPATAESNRSALKKLRAMTGGEVA